LYVFVFAGVDYMRAFQAMSLHLLPLFSRVAIDVVV
jgi:hypothetical protein